MVEPERSGLGVNLTQQSNSIYATFHIYGHGPNGKAAWFAALLNRDGTAERFTGTLHRFTGVQFGKLLVVDNATYSCPDSAWNSPARVYNLCPTPAGFEAQWFSNAGGGCTEDADLSGVRFR